MKHEFTFLWLKILDHFLLEVNFAVIILWLNNQLGCKVKWENEGQRHRLHSLNSGNLKWMSCCRRWLTVVGMNKPAGSSRKRRMFLHLPIKWRELIDKQFHWGSEMRDGAESPAGDYAALLPYPPPHSRCQQPPGTSKLICYHISFF